MPILAVCVYRRVYRRVQSLNPMWCLYEDTERASRTSHAISTAILLFSPTPHIGSYPF